MSLFQDELKRQVAATGSVVVMGLDTDDAGEHARERVAGWMMEAGLRPTEVRVVTWPAHDVNDWLIEGGNADQAAALLSNGLPTWVDVMIDKAKPGEDADQDEAALRDLFRVLAGMDVYDIARMREKVCEALDMRRSDFDAILRATRREAGLSEDGKPKYLVVAGRTAHRFYDRAGNEVVNVLSNFDARITAEIVDDDGSMQERRFLIDGKLADGGDLPQVEVLAGEFASMGWVLEQWGARALIEAGGSTKDHLRTAIQLLSPTIPTRYIYSHLGWRKVQGQAVYLSMEGAVGRDGVEVRLIPDLARYKLPTTELQDARTAMHASLRFLEVGDYTATVPLWAAMFLAPLSSVIEPAFTVWIFGTTGSLKSTITALAMCHFGTFSYNTPPASWTGTANALEKKAFLVKDAPLWIDDYTTQSTASGMQAMRMKVDQLLRDWGNRSGRSRMQADLRLRQTFAPRGMIVSTAEQLPQGESIQARLFQVEIDPKMITRGADSPLTVAQTEDAPLYSHAMAGYLLWLADQMDELERVLPLRLLDYTEMARERGAHLRMPMNVASLFVGWELGLLYAKHVGAVDEAHYEDLRQLGWDVLVSLGEAQMTVAQEEKPVELYLSAIEQLLATGAVYLKHRHMPDMAERYYPVDRMPNAEMIGWYGNDETDSSGYRDSRYWYLIPNAAFKAVVTFWRGSGVVFPDTARGIKVKLLEQKLLLPAQGRGYDYQIKPDWPRVLRVIRPGTEEAGPEGVK